MSRMKSKSYSRAVIEEDEELRRQPDNEYKNPKTPATGF